MSNIFTGNEFKLSLNLDPNNRVPQGAGIHEIPYISSMPTLEISSSVQSYETYGSGYEEYLLDNMSVSPMDITVSYVPNNEIHQQLEDLVSSRAEFQLILQYMIEDDRISYAIVAGKLTSKSTSGTKDSVVSKTYQFKPTNLISQYSTMDALDALYVGNFGVGSNGIDVPQYETDAPTGNAFIKVPSNLQNNPTGTDLMGVGFIDGDSTAAFAMTKSGTLSLFARNQTTAWTRIYTATQMDGRYVPLTRTINGHALSSNVTVTKGDVGLGNVTNDAQLKIASNLDDLSDKEVARTNLDVYSKSEVDTKDATLNTKIDNVNSTLSTEIDNTNKNISTNYVPKTTTVNGHALSSNVTVTKGDVGLGNVTNDAQVKKAGDTMTGALIVDSTLTVNQLSNLSGGYIGQQDAIDIQNQAISLNSLTIPYGSPGNTNLYGCPSTGGGSSITEKPAGVTGDFLLYVELIRAANANDWANRQTIVCHVNKKSYVRWVTHTSTSDTWTDWTEQLTGIVPIANGGTGSTTVDGARNALSVGRTSTVSFGSLELSAATPFIDFHFNNSTADYTTRLVEQTSGTLSLIGNSAISGNLNVQGNVNLTNNLTVANGGTGAGTAAGARTNLEVYSKAEVDGSIARLTLPGISNGSANYYKVATLKDSGNSSGYVEFTVYGSGGYGSRVTNVDYITLSSRNLSAVTSANVANYITHTRLTYSTASALRMGMVVNTDKSVDVYIIAPNGYWGGTNAMINAISGGGTYILGDISTKTSTQAWTTTAPTDIVTIPYSELLTNTTTGSSVTYNVGTSGNTIPLLDGNGNVWTNSQTIGTSGEKKLTIVNSTLRDNGNGGFIISSNSGTTAGNVGLYLRPVGDTVSTVQILGNNSGWTIAGATTISSALTTSGATTINGTLTTNNTVNLSGGYSGNRTAIDITGVAISLNSCYVPATSPGQEQVWICATSGGGSGITSKPSDVTGNFWLQCVTTRLNGVSDSAYVQTLYSYDSLRTYMRYGKSTSATASTWGDWTSIATTDVGNTWTGTQTFNMRPMCPNGINSGYDVIADYNSNPSAGNGATKSSGFITSRMKGNGALSDPAGAVFRLYMQEKVGTNHYGILNLNGYSLDRNWFFNSDGTTVSPNGTLQVQGSDVRLKENFVQAESGAAERISKIGTVEFNFRGQKRTQRGFVAQQMQQIDDMYTFYGGENTDVDGNKFEVLNLDNIAVLADLVTTVQEQMKAIAELKAEIEQLKSNK
ncbi:tail fiber domain-containing protein [Klebsiella michiganensis]|nr:tail fiber domain-containing protein [Klebsiella michiganensis]MBG2586409.1 tail fiber domain-containing protein [Klebsiella michiganensis]